MESPPEPPGRAPARRNRFSTRVALGTIAIEAFGLAILVIVAALKSCGV